MTKEVVGVFIKEDTFFKLLVRKREKSLKVSLNFLVKERNYLAVFIQEMQRLSIKRALKKTVYWENEMDFNCLNRLNKRNHINRELIRDLG